jgi:DNA-binding transcriptional ArsR family regulator
MQRTVRQIDTETGEVLDDGTLVYVPHRARIKEAWMMTFQDGMLALAKDRDLNGETWRVFACLVAKLDFENFIHIGQVDICNELEMKAPNVSRAIARLRTKGILIEGPTVGRSRTYRLSPAIAWKGRVTNLERARKRHLEVVRGEKHD